MTKKDPRIKKTLLQIDNALLDNLAQFPFSKITTDMLCRCALVNRSTFYKYYKDKYDLLDNYLLRTLSRFQDHANVSFVLASTDTVDNITYQNIFESFLDYFMTEKDTIEILWKADIERNIFNEMCVIISSCITEKVISEFDPSDDQLAYISLYAQLFSSNLMVIIRCWYQHPTTFSKNDVMRMMTQNMKNGLFYTFKNIVK